MQIALGHQWMTISGSRACPRCLLVSDAWPLWWRLGIAAVCPIHRCLLIDTCPACGIGLRRGCKFQPRRLLRRTHKNPDLKECGNRPKTAGGPRPRDVCRQRITEIPTRDVPQALADFQKRAISIADGGNALIAGKSVTAADWFATVRYVAAAARLTAHDGELIALPDFAAESLARARDARHESRVKHSHGGVSDPGAKPETAAEAAAVLGLAEPVVDAPDRDSCPNYLALWARRLSGERQTRHHGMDPLRKIYRPSIVDEMAVVDEKVAATTPWSQRAASVKPAFAATDFEIRHVPHLIDIDDYHDLVAAHLPGMKVLVGRYFAALALARFAGAAPGFRPRRRSTQRLERTIRSNALPAEAQNRKHSGSRSGPWRHG